MNCGLGHTFIVAALIITGCGNASSATDAAVLDSAGPFADAAIDPDGAISLNWVDFAITGCAFEAQPTTSDGDAGVADAGIDPDANAGGDAGMGTGLIPCVGSAPLALRFTTIAPALVDTYRWDFGDGETADVAAPTHVYTELGTYLVELTVAGPRGTAQRYGAIEVQPAALGAVCTNTDQCEPGLSCLCGTESTCPQGLEPGRCTAACEDEPCASGACVNLAAGLPDDPPGAPETEPADWQRSLCLPTCADSADCPDGLTCQTFVAPSGAFVSACFAPGVLGAIGDSCYDADSAPVHSACASGYCASLGIRGMCSSPCTTGDCPSSSACASFENGERACIARCETQDACTDDPWLGCEQPGGAEPFGFTVDEIASELGYCAPRSCIESSECGLDGVCDNGFCSSN